jgi:acyl carrier protein
MNGSHLNEARGLVAVALGLSIDDVPSDGDADKVPGWDSLSHVRLVLSLETKLGRTLVPEEIIRLRSVRAGADVLVHDA